MKLQAYMYGMTLEQFKGEETIAKPIYTLATKIQRQEENQEIQEDWANRKLSQ